MLVCLVLSAELISRCRHTTQQEFTYAGTNDLLERREDRETDSKGLGESARETEMEKDRE